MPVTLVPRSEERRRLVCHLFEGEERTRTPMVSFMTLVLSVDFTD